MYEHGALGHCFSAVAAAGVVRPRPPARDQQVSVATQQYREWAGLFLRWDSLCLQQSLPPFSESLNAEAAQTASPLGSPLTKKSATIKSERTQLNCKKLHGRHRGCPCYMTVKRLCQCDEREGNGTGRDVLHADWVRTHVVAAVAVS